jgi:acyl-CoA synthetase (AMP-forming)/AMP-acid ligase II
MASQFHLADLFETVAAAVPERMALIGDSARYSFAELNDRCDRLAAGLAAQGVTRGDAIGLYMYNSPAYLEAFIAACKLGAVPYNVNYRYRAEELRYLFANADSAAIIHGAEFSPIVRDVRGDVPTLKVTVAVEDGSGADTSGSVSYGDLMAHEPGGPWARHEDDILLCYTGGTTGHAQGRDVAAPCLSVRLRGRSGLLQPAWPGDDAPRH